jgi:hypothetical protein
LECKKEVFVLIRVMDVVQKGFSFNLISKEEYDTKIK